MYEHVFKIYLTLINVFYTNTSGERRICVAKHVKEGIHKLAHELQQLRMRNLLYDFLYKRWYNQHITCARLKYDRISSQYIEIYYADCNVLQGLRLGPNIFSVEQTRNYVGRDTIIRYLLHTNQNL